MKTLRYLYTTGCNIPIFVSGLGRDKIKAIKTTTSGYDIRWIFKPIYYQGLLQKKQEKVFTTMKNRAELDWLTLRRFLLFGFSDAAGLEYRAAVPIENPRCNSTVRDRPETGK